MACRSASGSGGATSSSTVKSVVGTRRPPLPIGTETRELILLEEVEPDLAHWEVRARLPFAERNA